MPERHRYDYTRKDSELMQVPQVQVPNSVSHVFEFVVQDSRLGLDPRAVVVVVMQRERSSNSVGYTGFL